MEQKAKANIYFLYERQISRVTIGKDSTFRPVTDRVVWAPNKFITFIKDLE